MSTLKVNILDTPSGSGNITLNRPIVGSGTLPAANLTGTLPAISGASLTNLPASDPFPYSGSAIISSSYTAGDTNSNVLKLIGSGSVSGSSLFDAYGGFTRGESFPITASTPETTLSAPGETYSSGTFGLSSTERGYDYKSILDKKRQSRLESLQWQNRLFGSD